jgi:hypothetical protein
MAASSSVRLNRAAAGTLFNKTWKPDDFELVK